MCGSGALCRRSCWREEDAGKSSCGEGLVVPAALAAIARVDMRTRVGYGSESMNAWLLP